jgi:ABC-2 type transport system permease protein
MAKGIGDDFRQIGVVTKYEVLKHLRSRRVMVFVCIAALLFILITILNLVLDGKLPDQPKEFMETYLSFITLLLIIGVSLLCGSTIAAEFEERTALLMFPRPMKRTSFFIGKILACFIVCGAVIVLYYAVCMLVSLIAAGGIDPNTLISLGMAILFMLGAGGLALLMSTLFKKGSTAIIFTIVLLLLVFNIIDRIMAAFEVEPIFSITYAGKDIMNAISGLHSGIPEDIPPGILESLEKMGISLMQYYPTRALAIGIMLTWFTVSTVISAWLFKNKEF